LFFFYNIKKKCFIFVLGLCGNFDDNKENDRMMSDGTLYTGTSKRPVHFSYWFVTTHHSPHPKILIKIA
jgi:hypothetical protein